LVLGAAISSLPLCWSMLFTDHFVLANPWPPLGLVLLGLPYSEVALMICFLHENPLAATPARVVGNLVGHGGSLLPMVLKVTAILGLGPMAFAMALTLRADHFWLYLIAALGCWANLIWTTMVAMRIMGVAYFLHRLTLKWDSDLRP